MLRPPRGEFSDGRIGRWVGVGGGWRIFQTAPLLYKNLFALPMKGVRRARIGVNQTAAVDEGSGRRTESHAASALWVPLARQILLTDAIFYLQLELWPLGILLRDGRRR